MAEDRNQYRTEFQCPACGKRDTFVMHTLIDTGKDPDAEQKIFNGDYFAHTCSRCHTVTPVLYSCMYHDSKRKLLIGLADSEKDLEEMRLTLNGSYHRDQLDDVLHDWLKTCTVRLVRSEYELQEKVLIAHFNLDDRVIELARKIVRNELAEKREDIEHLYFNTAKGGYVFLIGTKEGIDGMIPFSDEMYQEIAGQYKDVLAEDTSIEINEEWAEEVL